MTPNTRRSFMKLAGKSLIVLPLGTSLVHSGDVFASSSGETAEAKANSREVKLNVKDFGAKGDGSTKDTLAIQETIDRCSVLGGGEVLVPAGSFLTGALSLKSNVTLRLEKDAVLLGTPDLADYPVTQVRWEGKWIQGHVGLIYAIGATNIAIEGPGKIAGSHLVGGRPSPTKPFRRPALIEPIGCKNIKLSGFSTDYHLMWSIHPTYCENININNLVIRSTGGNGDGIDIDSCKHVIIDSCDISTGDDCISLKSGRGMEGYTLLKTTEDIHISNCTFADSIFACIGIGSETSGGIRNVRIENCKFIHAKTHAIYIKSRPGRGAFIENISVDNIDVAGTEGGFLRFNILGSGLQDQVPVPGFEGIPTIKNFKFSNIRVHDVPVLVDGTAIHPDKPLDGFTLKNVSGTCRKGISLANIKKANIKNIEVTGFDGPLIGIYNVNGSGLSNAEPINGPKVPDPVIAIPEGYHLH